MQSDDDDATELRLWHAISRDLLAVVGSNGYFLRLSDSWSDTLGYPLEELLARPFADFIHPEDRELSLLRLAEHEAQGSDTIGLINRYVHADGSVRWLQWNGQTERSGGRVYAVARDVTASRLRNEQAATRAAAVAAVLSARTLDDILQVVTEEARALIGTRQSVTSLSTGFGGSPGRTAVSLSTDYAAWREPDEGPRPSAFYAEVSRTNVPMRLTQQELEAHPLWMDYLASGAQPPPMRGWLAVPVVDRNGSNVGVIQLSDKVDGTEFDEGDASLLLDLARPAGLAIERGLLREATAAALAQQQLVVTLGQAALGDEGLPAILASAVAACASLLGVSTVAVIEISISADRVLVAPLSAVPAGAAATSITPEEFYPSTSAAALRTGLPVAEEDYAAGTHALGREAMAKYGLRSAVSVPMTAGGDFTGVLYAADAQPLRFGDLEIAFLQQVANVLSSAIAQSHTQQRVLHQATHDALTGLPNRSVLRSALETSLATTLPAGERTGLLLLDLDGFKDVNDSLGHAAGDLVLEQLAVRLSDAAGEGALVARLGGDEFAVCFSVSRSAAQLEAVADRLTGALLTPFDVEGLDVPLSASIGVVVAPEHGTDASTLFRHADVAMYRAKAQRIAWATYEEQVDHARAVRLTSISELRQAIRDGDLELHYQPIIALRDGHCAQVEALVRWRHATRGLIYPDDFVPLAEQTGLIGDLTAWVIERAVSDLAGWRREGSTLRCAVNLSVEALSHPAKARDLVDRIIEHYDTITIEITESALADTRARRTLRELAGAGVSCAIDDFGTGYSSLAALKSLPISTVKIDREFVRELDSSSQDLAIIKSVAQLAAALSLGVIAEGVETQATGERLAEMSIPLAQGYYYARPMPAADVQTWLAANQPAGPAYRR